VTPEFEASPRFAGYTAVITGGGRGIGRATALRLAAEGAHVVIADMAQEFADEVAALAVAAGGSAESWRLDATDASSVGRFFYTVGEARGSIDVLVNCPAHASDTHFERVTEAEFNLDIAVTLKAPFLCIQAALPYLLRSGHGGSVVSIGSVNGIAAFGNEVYGAAKAGLMSLTQNLALRYGSAGLRFNVVAPGTVRTRSWETRMAGEPDILSGIADIYPLGRVGAPEDIAAAVAFLASSDAAWITGVTLPVDGGITAGHGELIGAIFGESFFSTMLDERPSA
jgi:meso-butanediol dehydrogenase/(S,S)-butanediol dehydrogenase/diacetyl reductase